MKRVLAGAGFALAGTLVLATPVHAQIEVRVEGAVSQPGTLQLKDAARISDAALAAKVQPDAYMLGAAWLRPSRIKQQTRDKAGVLYDLDALHRDALLNGNAGLAQTVSHMRQWVSGLPITGREPALLDPRVVEATAAANWPLDAGDTLFYPAHPTTVRVVGALPHTCTLPFEPMQDARHYLALCPPARDADKDWAWVIQPDGRAFKLGVALWNLSNPLPVAPGATIYLPVREHLADKIDPDLNRDLAAFLATQILPGPKP